MPHTHKTGHCPRDSIKRFFIYVVLHGHYMLVYIVCALLLCVSFATIRRYRVSVYISGCRCLLGFKLLALPELYIVYMHTILCRYFSARTTPPCHSVAVIPLARHRGRGLPASPGDEVVMIRLSLSLSFAGP